jgi:hypothetical protein
MVRSRSKQNLLQFFIPLLMVLFILPGQLIGKGSTRIVIKKSNQENLEGTLLSVDVGEKSLVVQTDSGGIRISMDEIDTLWLEKGSPGKGHIGKSILVGVALGAGVGYVTYSTESDYPRRYLVTFFAVIFGFLGLIQGLTKKTHRKGPKRYDVKRSTTVEVKRILKKLKKRAQMK